MRGIPSLKEQGIDVELGNWRGIFGAPGHHPAQRDALVKRCKGGTETPAWKETLEKLGWEPVVPRRRRVQGKFLEEDTKRIGGIIESLGLEEVGTQCAARAAEIALSLGVVALGVGVAGGHRDAALRGRLRRHRAELHPAWSAAGIICSACGCALRGVHRRLARPRRRARASTLRADAFLGQRRAVRAHGADRLGRLRPRRTVLFACVARGFGSRRCCATWRSAWCSRSACSCSSSSSRTSTCRRAGCAAARRGRTSDGTIQRIDARFRRRAAADEPAVGLHRRHARHRRRRAAGRRPRAHGGDAAAAHR